MDSTTKLLILAGLAYVAFIHNGGLFGGAPQQSPTPAQTTSPTDNSQAVATTITAGLNLARDLFILANRPPTTVNGSGVANV